MKKSYLFKLILSGFILSGQYCNSQTWNTQTSGSPSNLNAISMPSSSIGAAAGANGDVRYSSNGGTNWSELVPTISSNRFGISFVSTTLGWMVDGFGNVWKTTTGPAGWTSQTSPTTNPLYSVDFVNSTTGWAGGVGGTLIKTTNGSTWGPLSSGITTDIRSLDAVDVNNVWIVGAGGVIRKTADGGTTWSPQPSGTTTVTFVDVFFVDANVGWVVGTSGTIKKTTDGGATWNNQTSGTTVTLRSVHFVSATQGWAVGDNGTIRTTTNGGTTWTSQSSGTTQTLNCVYMTSASEGWAAGNAGVIRKYCTLPTVPASVSGATAVCIGSSETYSVPNEAGVTYTWTFPAGWTQTSGGTSNSVTVTVGSSSGNITVTPSNSCGTVSASSLSTTVSSTPSQPSSIMGDNFPCLGTTQVYSVNNVAGVFYNWFLPVGWSITAGSGTNSITVTVGSGSGDIIVLPANSCGAGISQILSAVVYDVPPAASSITGSVALCEGDVEVYSVTSTPLTNFIWTFPAGWTQSGGLSNSITATAGASSGVITVTPSNMCGDGSAASLIVTVSTLPSQPSNIIGNADVCEGEIEVYSISNVAGVDYVWTFPGDWTQLSGGLTNSVSVQVGAMSGTISISPSNECGQGSTPQWMSVSSTSIDNTVNVSGSTFTANEAGATYQWLDCNNGNAPINGATSQSYSPTAPGNYAVQIAVNGCVDTSECTAFVGLDEAEMQLFEVYPNPTIGTIHISAQQPMERIEVVSIYGQVVATYDVLGQTTTSIDIDGSTGFYYIMTYFLDSKIVGVSKIIKR